METIACKECGFANELERVYCHNCGVKLDRSLIPQDASPVASASKTRRRILRMMKPPRISAIQVLRSLVTTLALSVTFAAVIQMVRPPDDVPEMPKEHLVEAPQLRIVMEDAMAAPRGKRLSMSREIINSYLQNTLKGAATISEQARFDRCFVKLDEGGCNLQTQMSIFDYPIYAGSAYTLAIRDNNLIATNIGGNLGRLPVHPMIMAYADVAFQKIWEALKQERRLLSRMQSIEVHKEAIVVETKPAQILLPR
jgi:hypothetical protein